MNIGYLYGFNSYPPRGGGQIHVYNLVSNLTELGCKVHTFESETNPQCAIYPRTDEGKQRFLDSIDILCLRIDGGLLYRSGLKLYCMEHIKDKPIVWELNSPAEERLFRYRGVPLRSYIPASRNGVRQIKNWATDHVRLMKEEACRRKYAARVSAAICVSGELQGYAENELDIPRCAVIPNGADPSLFSPDKKDARLFADYGNYLKVLYTGDSGWPWQGFNLLKELAQLAQQRGDKVLFIALDNSAVKTRRLSENLLVLKGVPYADVPTYIASADVCLCLYEDFSWFRYGYYGSSNKLFCYMASGRPTIATRQGQLATAIEDGTDGLLTSNEVDEIYSKIRFCEQHRDKAEQIGKAAREKITGFYNWRRAAQATKSLFEALLH